MTAPTRPRRGPAPPPADLERGRLLDAGLALLTANGTDALTLTGILDEAGLGTRAFYRHFDTKDEFVLAVWLRSTEPVVRRLREVTDGAATGRAAVLAWIDDRLDAVCATPRSAAFEALWRYGFWLRSAFPTKFEAVSEPQVAVLAAAIARGVHDGSIVGADPDLDAGTIHATFWMLATRHLNRGDLQRRDIRRHLVRLTSALFAESAHVTSARR